MLNTYPVSIRKVNTNRRGGRGITGFTGYGNDFIAYAHYTFLLVVIHNRTVILKPLHVICDHSHTFACIKVFNLNDRFVGAAVSHWVIVYFYEAIDVIYITAGCFDPSNIVVIPLCEIPGLVVFNQKFQCGCLVFILRNVLCLF